MENESWIKSRSVRPLLHDSTSASCCSSSSTYCAKSSYQPTISYAIFHCTTPSTGGRSTPRFDGHPPSTRRFSAASRSTLACLHKFLVRIEENMDRNPHEERSCSGVRGCVSLSFSDHQIWCTVTASASRIHRLDWKPFEFICIFPNHRGSIVKLKNESYFFVLTGRWLLSHPKGFNGICGWGKR